MIKKIFTHTLAFLGGIAACAIAGAIICEHVEEFSTDDGDDFEGFD